MGIWGQTQKRWSILFKDKEVILAADFDRVIGFRTPAYLMAKMLVKEIPQLKIASFEQARHTTDGKIDIDSLITSGNLKSFERAINGAMDAKTWLELEVRRGYGKKR